jgi:hypothetical protein
MVDDNEDGVNGEREEQWSMQFSLFILHSSL